MLKQVLEIILIIDALSNIEDLRLTPIMKKRIYTDPMATTSLYMSTNIYVSPVNCYTHILALCAVLP